MFLWILQSAIISAIFIFLIHYLVQFFKNTLTSPKIKDFVTLPAQKYKQMFDTINRDHHSNAKSFVGESLNPMPETSDINALPTTSESSSMKMELKNFMKQHLTEPVSDASFLSANDFEPLSSTFSNF